MASEISSFIDKVQISLTFKTICEISDSLYFFSQNDRVFNSSLGAKSMEIPFRPGHPDVRPAITEEQWIQIDEIIAGNRKKPGSIITVLRECQNRIGYLPVELIDYISRGMNLSRSDIYGVASFYALFSMKPKGRHTIKLCLGTACYVKGIKEVLDRVSNHLRVEQGGTTEDRRFSLEAVRCLGACGLAPVMVVDSNTYGDVKADGVIQILEKYE